MEITYTLKTLTPDQLTALSRDVKRVLTDLYGDRLEAAEFLLPVEAYLTQNGFTA